MLRSCYFLAKYLLVTVWVWYLLLQCVRFFVPFLVYKLSRGSVQLEIGKIQPFRILPKQIKVTIAKSASNRPGNSKCNQILEASVCIDIETINLRNRMIFINLESVKLDISCLLVDILRSEPFEEKTINCSAIDKFFSVFAISIRKIDFNIRLLDVDIASAFDICDLLVTKAPSSVSTAPRLTVTMSSIKTKININNSASEAQALYFHGNVVEIAVSLLSSNFSPIDGEFLSRRVNIDATFDNGFKIRLSMPRLLSLYHKYVSCRDELIVECGGEELSGSFPFRNQIMLHFPSLCVIMQLGLNEKDPSMVVDLKSLFIGVNNGSSSIDMEDPFTLCIKEDGSMGSNSSDSKVSRCRIGAVSVDCLACTIFSVLSQENVTVAKVALVENLVFRKAQIENHNYDPTIDKLRIQLGTLSLVADDISNISACDSRPNNNFLFPLLMIKQFVSLLPKSFYQIETFSQLSVDVESIQVIISGIEAKSMRCRTLAEANGLHLEKNEILSQPSTQFSMLFQSIFLLVEGDKSGHIDRLDWANEKDECNKFHEDLSGSKPLYYSDMSDWSCDLLNSLAKTNLQKPVSSKIFHPIFNEPEFVSIGESLMWLQCSQLNISMTSSPQQTRLDRVDCGKIMLTPINYCCSKFVSLVANQAIAVKNSFDICHSVIGLFCCQFSEGALKAMVETSDVSVENKYLIGVYGVCMKNTLTLNWCAGSHLHLSIFLDLVDCLVEWMDVALESSEIDCRRQLNMARFIHAPSSSLRGFDVQIPFLVASLSFDRRHCCIVTAVNFRFSSLDVINTVGVSQLSDITGCSVLESVNDVHAVCDRIGCCTEPISLNVWHDVNKPSRDSSSKHKERRPSITSSQKRKRRSFTDRPSETSRTDFPIVQERRASMTENLGFKIPPLPRLVLVADLLRVAVGNGYVANDVMRHEVGICNNSQFKKENSENYTVLLSACNFFVVEAIDFNDVKALSKFPSFDNWKMSFPVLYSSIRRIDDIGELLQSLLSQKAALSTISSCNDANKAGVIFNKTFHDTSPRSLLQRSMSVRKSSPSVSLYVIDELCLSLVDEAGSPVATFNLKKIDCKIDSLLMGKELDDFIVELDIGVCQRLRSDSVMFFDGIGGNICMKLDTFDIAVPELRDPLIIIHDITIEGPMYISSLCGSDVPVVMKQEKLYQHNQPDSSVSFSISSPSFISDPKFYSKLIIHCNWLKKMMDSSFSAWMDRLLAVAASLSSPEDVYGPPSLAAWDMIRYWCHGCIQLKIDEISSVYYSELDSCKTALHVRAKDVYLVFDYMKIELLAAYPQIGTSFIASAILRSGDDVNDIQKYLLSENNHVWISIPQFCLRLRNEWICKELLVGHHCYLIAQPTCDAYESFRSTKMSAAFDISFDKAGRGRGNFVDSIIRLDFLSMLLRILRNHSSDNSVAVDPLSKPPPIDSLAQIVRNITLSLNMGSGRLAIFSSPEQQSGMMLTMNALKFDGSISSKFCLAGDSGTQTKFQITSESMSPNLDATRKSHARSVVVTAATEEAVSEVVVDGQDLQTSSLSNRVKASRRVAFSFTFELRRVTCDFLRIGTVYSQEFVARQILGKKYVIVQLSSMNRLANNLPQPTVRSRAPTTAPELIKQRQRRSSGSGSMLSWIKSSGELTELNSLMEKQDSVQHSAASILIDIGDDKVLVKESDVRSKLMMQCTCNRNKNNDDCPVHSKLMHHLLCPHCCPLIRRSYMTIGRRPELSRIQSRWDLSKKTSRFYLHSRICRIKTSVTSDNGEILSDEKEDDNYADLKSKDAQSMLEFLESEDSPAQSVFSISPSQCARDHYVVGNIQKEIDRECIDCFFKTLQVTATAYDRFISADNVVINIGSKEANDDKGRQTTSPVSFCLSDVRVIWNNELRDNIFHFVDSALTLLNSEISNSYPVAGSKNLQSTPSNEAFSPLLSKSRNFDDNDLSNGQLSQKSRPPSSLYFLIDRNFTATPRALNKQQRRMATRVSDSSRLLSFVDTRPDSANGDTANSRDKVVSRDRATSKDKPPKKALTPGIDSPPKMPALMRAKSFNADVNNVIEIAKLQQSRIMGKTKDRSSVFSINNSAVAQSEIDAVVEEELKVSVLPIEEAFMSIVMIRPQVMVVDKKSCSSFLISTEKISIKCNESSMIHLHTRVEDSQQEDDVKEVEDESDFMMLSRLFTAWKKRDINIQMNDVQGRTTTVSGDINGQEVQWLTDNPVIDDASHILQPAIKKFNFFAEYSFYVSAGMSMTLEAVERSPELVQVRESLVAKCSVDLPEVQFDIDRVQFISLLDVTKNVLLAPPPKIGVTEETLSTNIVLPSTTKSLDPMLKAHIDELHAILEANLSYLSRIDVLPMRFVEYRLRRGNWKLRLSSSEDCIEIWFTGLSGQHTFFDDLSMNSQFDVERFGIKDSRDATKTSAVDPFEALSTDEAACASWSMVLVPDIGKEEVCRRCKEFFRPEINSANCCTYHGFDDGEEAEFLSSDSGGASFWECCGNRAKKSLGCRRGPHLCGTKIITVRADILPIVRIGGVDVTPIKHMEVSMFAGNTNHLLKFHLSKDVSEYIHSYFFVSDAIVENTESEVNEAKGDVASSSLNPSSSLSRNRQSSRIRKDHNGSQTDLGISDNMILIERGAQCVFLANWIAVVDNSSIKQSEANNVARKSDNRECVYVSYMRVGDVNVEVSLHGFAIDLDKYTASIGTFIQQRKLMTWTNLFRRFEVHATWSVSVNAAANSLFSIRRAFQRRNVKQSGKGSEIDLDDWQNDVEDGKKAGKKRRHTQIKDSQRAAVLLGVAGVIN